MEVKHGAKLLLIDAEDNVLLLRRSGTHPHIPYSTDLPGGELDSGESAEDAMIRELDEETKVKLKTADLRLVGKRQFGAFGREFDLYLFAAKVAEQPNVEISWEHDQYYWKQITEVHDLDDGFQPLLDAYLAARDA